MAPSPSQPVPLVQAVQDPFWQEQRAKNISQTSPKHFPGLRNLYLKDSSKVSTEKGSSRGKMEGGAGNRTYGGVWMEPIFVYSGEKQAKQRLVGFDLGRAGGRAPGSHSLALWPPEPPKALSPPASSSSTPSRVCPLPKPSLSVPPKPPRFPCPELCPLVAAAPQPPAGFVPHPKPPRCVPPSPPRCVPPRAVSPRACPQPQHLCRAGMGSAAGTPSAGAGPAPGSCRSSWEG